MVDRAITGCQLKAVAVGQCALNVTFGGGNGLAQAKALGKACGNAGGKGAATAMAGAYLQAGIAKV